MMLCTCPTWSLDSNFIKSLAQWFAHLWAFGSADLLLVPLSRVLIHYFMKLQSKFARNCAGSFSIGEYSLQVQLISLC
jgi:hypothetical protein